MDLDELLDHSAPTAAQRTPGLQSALERLAAEVESDVRRPPLRGRRVVVAAGAVLGLAGLGTAGAVAAGQMGGHSILPWKNQDGQTCVTHFVARSAPGKAADQAAIDEANRWIAARPPVVIPNGKGPSSVPGRGKITPTMRHETKITPAMRHKTEQAVKGVLASKHLSSAGIRIVTVDKCE